MARVKRTKKVRRHSGRVTPDLTIKCKRKELIEGCLEPQEFWDDWTDHRDSMRSPVDNTKIRDKNADTFGYLEVERYNKKLKKLLKRRKAMKNVRK